MESVSLVMSTDGVLMITVPKEETRNKRELTIPMHMKYANNTDEAEVMKDQTASETSITRFADLYKKNINDKRTVGVDEILRQNHKSSADENLDFLLSRPDTQSLISHQEEEGRFDHLISSNQKYMYPKSTLSCSSSRADVPIMRKRLFFQDSFFRDSQGNFATAVKDVLDKFSARSSKEDDLTTYKNLRKQNPKLENQAVHVEENHLFQKIVLDVQDFLEGEIKIAINEDREIVIKGKAERRDSTRMTTLSFLRRFLLPAAADADDVSAVMSADGVLIVISPKREMPSSCGPLKMSTESKSRTERQRESGHRWDERNERDSSERSLGCKSGTLRSNYRTHHQHSSSAIH